MGAERAARGRGRGGIAQDTYRPELCFSRRSELRQCRDEQCTWGCAHLVPGLLQCRHSDLFWCGIDAGGHRFAVPMQQWQKGRKSRKTSSSHRRSGVFGGHGCIAVSLRCTRYRGDRYANAYWLYCSGIIGNYGGSQHRLLHILSAISTYMGTMPSAEGEYGGDNGTL